MTTECHFSQCKYHSCHEGDEGPFCYMDFDNLPEDAYCKILYKELFKKRNPINIHTIYKNDERQRISRDD